MHAKTLPGYDTNGLLISLQHAGNHMPPCHTKAMVTMAGGY
jgi:hypothetical protein